MGKSYIDINRPKYLIKVSKSYINKMPSFFVIWQQWVHLPIYLYFIFSKYIIDISAYFIYDLGLTMFFIKIYQV